MNKVCLIGNLVKDPELKFTPGKGTANTTFTIAINDGYGENKRVNYIPIVVWGKTAESVASYMTKGSKIAITGKIQTRNYENKEGKKVYITEVVADMYNGVKFLNSKNNSNGNSEQDLTLVNDTDMPF